MKATKYAGVRGTLGLILGVTTAALTPAPVLAQGIREFPASMRDGRGPALLS